MQVIKIDLKRIDQSKCFKGKNGTVYLDAIVFDNDEPDQYGNTQVIYQSVSKEERERGVKGKIIGNGREIGKKSSKTLPIQATNHQPKPEEENIPF